MEINKALTKIFSLHQFGIKLGLESINKLLNIIGNPHKDLKVIHVAGSNGKGSTSSFIASILMEAGFKVGLYTSPHFVKFNERIRVNAAMIEDDYVAGFVALLEKHIETEHPTFFEITTALAFKYFKDKNVDYAVIETGLGGRLDATNVVNPLASVITSISLEHTEHLGGTVELISAEKAGIIKPGVPLFVGRLPKEADIVMRSHCASSGSYYYSIPEFTEMNGGRLIVKLNRSRFSIYETPLRGEYQLFNSALAVKVVNESLSVIDGIAFAKGIKNVVQNTGISGRYEILHSKPTIILDSAHNPEGVAAFATEFLQERGKYSSASLLFAAMKDKAIEEMLSILQPLFDSIYITEVEIERAIRLDQLEKIAEGIGIKAGRVTDPVSFVNGFLKGDPGRSLVIIGSMYLVGEIKSGIIKENA